MSRRRRLSSLPTAVVILGCVWTAGCARPPVPAVHIARSVDPAGTIDAPRLPVEITLVDRVDPVTRADMLGCPQIAVDRGDRNYHHVWQPEVKDEDGNTIWYFQAFYGKISGWQHKYGERTFPVRSSAPELRDRVTAMGAGTRFRGVVVAGYDGPDAGGKRGDAFLFRADEDGHGVFYRRLRPLDGDPSTQVRPEEVVVDSAERIYVLSSASHDGQPQGSGSIEGWSGLGRRLFRRELDRGFSHERGISPFGAAGPRGPLAAGADSGLVVALSGETDNRSAPPTQVVHFDERGDERWRLTWSKGGPAPALAADLDGNTYVAGFVRDEVAPREAAPRDSGSSPAGRLSLARLDPSGHVVWRHSLPTGGLAHPVVLAFAAELDGRLWLAGAFQQRLDLDGPWSLIGHPLGERPGRYPYTLFLARFSPWGTTEWATVLGGPFEGFPDWIRVTLAASPSGGIVAAIPYKEPLLLPGLTRNAPPSGARFGCLVARLSAPK